MFLHIKALILDKMRLFELSIDLMYAKNDVWYGVNDIAVEEVLAMLLAVIEDN